MLEVTNLTFVFVGTGLHLPSLIWARPNSFSAGTAPPDCDVFVVLLAGLDALCLLDFLAIVFVSVSCLFLFHSPLSYF